MKKQIVLDYLDTVDRLKHNKHVSRAIICETGTTFTPYSSHFFINEDKTADFLIKMSVYVDNKYNGKEAFFHLALSDSLSEFLWRFARKGIENSKYFRYGRYVEMDYVYLVMFIEKLKQEVNGVKGKDIGGYFRYKDGLPIVSS